MKKTITKKTILLVSIILTAGFIATQVYAHMGGYNMGGGYHMGNGYNMMSGPNMGYGMGYGHMWNNLSAEDQKKMQGQMDSYYEATKGIRLQINQKQLELNTEALKTKQDPAVIDKLEQELFDLSAQLDRERFNHMKKMRSLFPGNDGRSFMSRGMGYGYGGGCQY